MAVYPNDTNSRRARRSALLAAFGMLTACVEPSVRPIVAPSGQAAYFISCPDSGQCYELAGKQCPQGYDIQRARGSAIESYVVACRQPQTATAQYYPAPVDHTPAAAVPAASPYGWQQQPPTAAQQPRWAPPPAPPPPPATYPTAETTVSDGPHGFRPIASDELDVGY